MMEKNSFLVQALNHIAAHPAIALSTACLLLLYVYMKISHTYWKTRGVPQLNPFFPFGDLTSVIFGRKHMAVKLAEVYDLARVRGYRYVGLYMFSRKAVMPVDPLIVKDIMARFLDRGIHFDEKNDPISAHLFSLAGAKWKKLRTKLSPAYSPKQLKNMFGVMLDCGLKMMEIVEEHAVVGKPVEIRETFARYTTDVIGSCAFGLECNSMRDPNAEFRRMGKRAFTQTVGDIMRITIVRNFPRLAQLIGVGIFSTELTEFFRRVVRETVEHRERNDLRRDDFLQILINLKNNPDLEGEGSGEALTIDEIAAQAFLFFLAGFETTSTTTSYTIFELAMNMELQEKARLEVRKVLKKHGGAWSYDYVQDLSYLDMVVHETMRKYPAAPVFLRKCTEYYQLPDSNGAIEEGFTVVVPTLGLQRDPEYFPDPLRYDPERFSEENRSRIWDYTYMPFGNGPRICIGKRFALLQLKMTLSLLLDKYNFTLNPKTTLPITVQKKGILLTPAEDIWINFEPIK